MEKEKAKVVRVTPVKNDVIMLLLKTENGKYGRTYTGPKYRNYVHWSDLKIGDDVEGIDWKDEDGGIINADSPVHII